MSQLNFNLNLVTHWNVGGADFYDKHKFFESQFEQLDEFVEKVAERIRSIGHDPLLPWALFSN